MAIFNLTEKHLQKAHFSFSFLIQKAPIRVISVLCRYLVAISANCFAAETYINPKNLRHLSERGHNGNCAVWLFFSDERLSALGRWEFKHWHLQRLRNLNSVPCRTFFQENESAININIQVSIG